MPRRRPRLVFGESEDPEYKSTKLRCDGALDIETEGWDKFVLGGLWYDGRMTICRDEGQFFARLEECTGTIWTWAGGRYDLIWLAYQCARRGVEASISVAGARITKLSIKDGPEFRDGFALFPVALKKAAPICGMQKQETGLDCECGKGCGGYCAIKRGMSDENYRRCGEYLEADLLCTAGVVEFLISHALDEGIELRGTIGASAWATAEKRFEIPKAVWQSDHYNFARMGYYGGRTEVYQTEAPQVHLHDLNSAYPWSLTCTAIPMGEPSWAPNPRKAWTDEKPGVYEATVTVPECDFPPLPMRMPGRVVFPTGTFDGTWTQKELAYAVDQGARVDDVRRALVWPRAELALADFCNWGWGRRHAADKESTLGGWWKWFLNSLTGKLAMAPEAERLMVAPDPDKIKRCPGGDWCLGVLCHAQNRCCSHVACKGTCMKWEPVDKGELLWAIPEWKLHDCAHVQAAAYLTANTRIELNCMQREAGSSMVYSDTDSCYTDERQTRRPGKELGEWNYEGEGRDWRAIAPKAYAYWHVEKDKQVVKSKGINSLKTRADFDAWAAGAEARDDRGVESLKVGASRANKETGDDAWFRKRTLKRRNRQQNSPLVGGRKLVGNRTEPCDSREISLLLAEALRRRNQDAS